MAHAFDEDEFRARNGFRSGSTAAHVAHPVSETMNDESRSGDPAKTGRAISCGDGGNRLTRECGVVVVAVVGQSGAGREFGYITGEIRRTDGPHRHYAMLDVCVARFPEIGRASCRERV